MPTDDEVFAAIAAAETSTDILVVQLHNRSVEFANDALGLPSTLGMVASKADHDALLARIERIVFG